MMPLTMLNSGETAEIKRIKGRDDVKRFLENLGFVTGEEVKVVSSNEGERYCPGERTPESRSAKGLRIRS